MSINSEVVQSLSSLFPLDLFKVAIFVVEVQVDGFLHELLSRHFLQVFQLRQIVEFVQLHMALHRVLQAQLAESRRALNIAVGINNFLVLTLSTAAVLGMTDSRATVGAFLEI